MRIVAVTRVLNEDDIIEAFIRHHAGLVDHHIFLDNGSIDHTISIIQRLRTEGLPITLCSNASVIFQEIFFNTVLYQIASTVQGADWVCFLDCDEFVDLRNSGTDLRGLLANVPLALPAIRLNMINYRDTLRDDPSELIVPLRLGYRARDMADVWKICIRAQLPDVVIEPGNHRALAGGRAVPCAETDLARLAHFPTRSWWQEIAKVVVGRLKVLATDSEAVLNSHYNHLFEMLLHRPGEILGDAHIAPAEVEAHGLVHDPIRYEGGKLLYTNGTDYRMKAVQSLLSYAERLARRHGELLRRTSGGAPMSEDLEIKPIPLDT